MKGHRCAEVDVNVQFPETRTLTLDLTAKAIVRDDVATTPVIKATVSMKVIRENDPG